MSISTSRSENRPWAVSRRVMLGFLPVVVVTRPATAGAPSNWEAAMQDYVLARRTHERFVKMVLDPASRSFEAGVPRSGYDADIEVSRPYGLFEAAPQREKGRSVQVRIFKLEEKGDALLAVRHETLYRLLSIPATDAKMLRNKLSLAYEEVLQFQDEEGLIQSLVADVHRLVGS